MTHYKYRDKNGVEKAYPKGLLRTLYSRSKKKNEKSKPPAPGGEIYQSIMLEAKIEFDEWESNISKRDPKRRGNGKGKKKVSSSPEESEYEEGYYSEEQEGE